MTTRGARAPPRLGLDLGQLPLQERPLVSWTLAQGGWRGRGQVGTGQVLSARGRNDPRTLGWRVSAASVRGDTCPGHMLRPGALPGSPAGTAGAQGAPGNWRRCGPGRGVAWEGVAREGARPGRVWPGEGCGLGTGGSVEPEKGRGLCVNACWDLSQSGPTLLKRMTDGQTDSSWTGSNDML